MWPFERSDSKNSVDADREEPRLRPQSAAQKLSELERWEDLFTVGTSTAGQIVNRDTAMRSSAVFACVRLIAGSVATLPLSVYRRTGDTRERVKDHPYAALLQESPNSRETAPVFWETSTANVLLDGNSYAIIRRSRNGRAVALDLRFPAGTGVEEKDGRLRYQLRDASGQFEVLDQDDVLHMPGLGWNGRKALSPISHHARSIGLDLAAVDHTAGFFERGGSHSVVLKYPRKLTDEQIVTLRDQYQDKYGGVRNHHKPLVLQDGGEAQMVTMSARDAQLAELLKFTAIDIARIYGVPPHMIGETSVSTSWGSGIEQQSIGFVVYTLRAHLRRFEKEINRKLFRGPDTDLFAEFNVTGLLQGDVKARGDYYRTGLGGNQQPGWMTVNEVRRLENLPPVDDGERLYVPVTGEPTERDTDDE